MSYRLEMKRRIGRLARRLPSPQPRRVILLYHSVGASPWGVTPDTFRRQMDYLARSAQMMPLNALVDERAAAPLQVAVTFDDGYATLHDTVRPIVRDLGIRPAVFLNTGWIEDVERRPSRPDLGHYEGEAFMNWGDVKALAGDGWTIGSHGVDHFDLTRLPGDRVTAELEQSRSTIQYRLGVACDSFAYTWGRHSPHLRALARLAGYRTGLGTRHAPLSRRDDPLALPRMDIRADYSFEDFVALVSGDWDYIGWVQSTRALAGSMARK